MLMCFAVIEVSLHSSSNISEVDFPVVVTCRQFNKDYLMGFSDTVFSLLRRNLRISPASAARMN